MTLKTLGPMLSEIHAMLQAKGCKVTEMSVTVHPLQDDASGESAEKRLWLDHPPRTRPPTRRATS